jgi:hypothetical protein
VRERLGVYGQVGRFYGLRMLSEVVEGVLGGL